MAISNRIDVAYRKFVQEIYGDGWINITVQQRNVIFQAFKAGYDAAKSKGN